MAAVDQGGGRGAVGAAQEAGAVAGAGGAGEADGRLQVAPGAGGPVSPDEAPPLRPVLLAPPVAELRLVVSIAQIKQY